MSNFSEKGYFWALSDLHLARNFAHPILGPWIFPAPLYEARLRMDDIISPYAGGVAEHAKVLISSDQRPPFLNEIGYALLVQAALAGNGAAALDLAAYFMNTPDAVVPDAMVPLLDPASTRACDAYFILSPAVADGYYPALQQALQIAEAMLRKHIPPTLFDRLMTQSNQTRFDLLTAQDIAEEEASFLAEKRAAFHSLIAAFLANGYPLPERFQPIARRLLSEAANPNVFDFPAPNFDLADFVSDGC